MKNVNSNTFKYNFTSDDENQSKSKFFQKKNKIGLTKQT